MGQRTDPPGWPSNRDATAQRILEFDWAEAALRASEEKYRTLFQTMGQGFCELEFVRDEQGRAVDFRYIELNPAFERLVGLPAAEARGRTGREVVPDLDLWWVETYDRIAATGLPARLEHTDTPMGRWFEVSVYPQANDRLLILYDDVTERKVAETALRDREERQAFLLALSDAVRSLTDPEAIQSAACRLVGERLDVDRCYYATADEAAGIIRIAWDHVRGDAPSIAGEHRLADFEWSAEILRRGECHVLADTQASVPEASRPAFAALQIGACMGTPLIKNGSLVGALWVTHSTPRDWTDADLGLLREVAERIWSAVERGRAEADIRRKNAVLEGINRIFREALTAPTEEELGRVCLAVAEDVTQSAFSFMGEVDHENDRFDELSISDRGWQHFAMENSAFSKGVGPKGLKIHGLYGRVLRDGKSLIANDPGSHPDRIGTPAGHPSLQAFLGVPLKRNGQTIGMIGLGNRAGGYRSEDLEAAEALAPAILQALLSKRTADTLRESEERFRTLAELVPSLLWNCDPEGKVIVVNQQWGAYTGQTQDEVQNGGWLATIPTDEREETKRIFTEAFTTGRPVERQQRIRRRDGPFRWFLIRHAPARDAEGRITRWIGAATDIHDQHIAAQSLRAEEARQAFLLDLADRLQDQTDPQAALQTVVEALGRHLGAGRVGYARLSADGKQIERQVGYHAESEARLGPLPITAFGRAVLDRLRNGETIIVDDAAAVAAPGVWRQGAVGSFVAVPLVRDGRVRTVLYLTHREPRTWTRSETTLIEEVAARTWEAAERAQAETELRTSEARQRALVEGIPQLVWRAGDGGAWSWASPQWCRYTGQTEAESRGFGWLDAVHPEDRDRAQNAWSGAAAAEVLAVDYRIRHAPEGRYRWFQSRALPLREGSDIVEWLGTSTDIDDLRQLQEQQGVMVAELQHRTRNLITVVRSLAEQTMARSDSMPMFRARFYDRLAVLSRVQGLLSRSTIEPITLHALIATELDALGAWEASDRIYLDGPSVRLRKATVQTFALALHELATNARKYGALSGDTGRLSVTWRTYTEDDRMRLALHWSETEIERPREEGAAQRRGYGRELIEKALPYALDARTRYELSETALHCSIDLPLTERRKAARQTKDRETPA
ncbi:putative sensory histidine kinase, putative methyltransferase, putative sensory_box: PAS domain S-box domain [Methylorubrum extorquens DM4]|uniref:Blue-light-activated histidine kinase n=1 Tax=Methylorubrum extorquens (strain DSM 6343 / CIP 106787 / DM4) TaxID=661410 RepID=C7CDE9_METED|nr:GAF domain-containing protein [Methylorubrum extorquens]CAX22677.1 putative sensory histidine kinase, putative methyltransferase, putative sensory_box: PAS domain S-box domain [Methylorubrum extorquens DM4]